MFDSMEITKMNEVDNVFIDHYPLPSLYRACLEETRKVMTGPPLYAAVDVYLMESLGSDSFREFFLTQWGDTLYHAILAEIAPVVPVLVQSVENGDSDEVVPVVSLFASKALVYVLNRGLKTDVALVVKALETYANGLDKGDDALYVHMEPLLPLLTVMSSYTVNPDRIEKWKGKIREYLGGIAVPSKYIHDRIEDTDAIMEEPAIPTVGISGSVDVGVIHQIDGSEAPDMTNAFLQLTQPSSKRKESIEEQIKHTLASHENPYKAPMELWWKLHASLNPANKHMEAWALDAAGRVLKELFTPSQIEAMDTLLPADEVVGSLLHYIIAEDVNARSVTWPQLRVSCLFGAIVHVVMDSETIEKRASEIYQKLNLEDEFSVMKSAINIHSDAASNMILPWDRRTIS